jgi:serine protease Do
MNNQKSIAILSCYGIFIVLLSFGAGFAGSFLGNNVFDKQEPGQVTSTSNQQVTVNEDSAVIDVVSKNQDSVVSIVISRNLTPQEQEFRRKFGVSADDSSTLGEGSGFILSAEGLIVTNRHVVNQANANYTVVLNNGTELAGKVLAKDTLLDIAIIKVEPKDVTLKPVTIGNSTDLKVGQRVVAIGNSLGEFSGTVSYGIVSGLSRSIVASDSAGSAERLDGVIQTDASINPGNSGGPLFDIQGNVIGVNVAVAQNAENIGFAIPISIVTRIIEDVEKFGEIRRPYLGVRYIPVNATIKEENKLTSDKGVLVVPGPDGEPGVLADSPAAKAGLKQGDQILTIDGVEVSETNSLQKVVQEKAVGDKVEIKLIRDGKEMTVSVTLEKAKS